MSAPPTVLSPRRALGRRALQAGAVVMVLAIFACVHWPMPTDVAERWLAQRFQRTVSIEGAASVCLCTGPTLRVASIEFGPPEWSQATRFLLATDSEIRFATTSLLRGRPRIASLRIGGGEVLLERRSDGRASWHFDKVRDTAGAAEPPRIDRLGATDLRWRMIDPARGADLQGTFTLDDGARASDGSVLAPSLVVSATGTLRDLPVEASARGGSAVTERIEAHPSTPAAEPPAARPPRTGRP